MFNMGNLNERKLNLLQSIGRLVRAIDDEVDWYISSFTEKDPKRKLLAGTFFVEKQKERERIAKEEYERYK